MPFDFDKIYGLLLVVIALSAASERLIAIVKGAPGIRDYLDVSGKKVKDERDRVWRLRLLAIGASLVTAFLARSWVLDDSVGIAGTIGLGLLASGGTDLWNSVLGWMNAVKDVAKGSGQDAKDKIAKAR